MEYYFAKKNVFSLGFVEFFEEKSKSFFSLNIKNKNRKICCKT